MFGNTGLLSNLTEFSAAKLGMSEVQATCKRELRDVPSKALQNFPGCYYRENDVSYLRVGIGIDAI